jgi:uncharacterized protein YggT (Ycf19 family)
MYVEQNRYVTYLFYSWSHQLSHVCLSCCGLSHACLSCLMCVCPVVDCLMRVCPVSCVSVLLWTVSCVSVLLWTVSCVSVLSWTVSCVYMRNIRQILAHGLTGALSHVFSVAILTGFYNSIAALHVEKVIDINKSLVLQCRGL